MNAHAKGWPLSTLVLHYCECQFKFRHVRCWPSCSPSREWLSLPLPDQSFFGGHGLFQARIPKFLAFCCVFSRWAVSPTLVSLSGINLTILPRPVALAIVSQLASKSCSKTQSSKTVSHSEKWVFLGKSEIGGVHWPHENSPVLTSNGFSMCRIPPLTWPPLLLRLQSYIESLWVPAFGTLWPVYWSRMESVCFGLPLLDGEIDYCLVYILFMTVINMLNIVFIVQSKWVRNLNPYISLLKFAVPQWKVTTCVADSWSCRLDDTQPTNQYGL